MTHLLEKAPDPSAEVRDAWNSIADGYDIFVTPSHMWLAGEGLQVPPMDFGDELLTQASR